MTIIQCTEWAQQHPNPILIFSTLVPVAAYATAMLLEDKSREVPGRYVFAFLVHGAMIAGSTALLMLGHSLISGRSFQKEQLLTLGLPILSMVLTALAAQRVIPLYQIPWLGSAAWGFASMTTALVIAFMLQAYVFTGGALNGPLPLLVTVCIVYGFKVVISSRSAPRQAS